MNTQVASSKEEFIQKNIDTKDENKPNYGLVGVKYYVYMVIIGIIGILIAVIGSQVFFPLNIILLFVGIPIAFICSYIGLSYIPFYFFMLKPGEEIDYWHGVFEKYIQGNEYVLDVGCGTGRIAIKVAKLLDSGNVVGIDLFKGSSGYSPDPAYRNAKIEGVSEKTEFKHGNLLKLEFLDNTFDTITSSSVLHDVHGDKNKEEAMKEIFRVLKPGGKFIAFEMYRDVRMHLAFLLFSFVFKPKHYWTELLNKFDFKNIKVEDYSQYLNYGLLIAEK